MSEAQSSVLRIVTQTNIDFKMKVSRHKEADLSCLIQALQSKYSIEIRLRSKL